MTTSTVREQNGLTPKASEAAQNLYADGLINLFTLNASRISNASSDIFRFTDTNYPDGKKVKFSNIEYEPLNFTYSGFEWSGDGSIPRPRLKLAATGDFLLNLAMEHEGGAGSELMRIVTMKKFLDGEEEGGHGIILSQDIYIIDRVIGMDSSCIELELVSMLDLQNYELPARQAIRDVCPWVYRRYEGNAFKYDQTTNACPYTGDACFNEAGESVTPANDVCGHKLEDCLMRFESLSKMDSFPFGGFPMLGRT